MLTALLDRPAVRHLAATLRHGVRRFPAAVPIVAVLLTALQASAVAGSQWGVHRLLSGLPTVDDVRRMGEMAQATVFYDAKDAPAFTIFDERRFDVALADVSPHLVTALLAIEDQRFRSHSGVDLVRILGATLANLREGRLAQGGSTITQQLARQSFLTLDKTYTRKVQEVLLALRIEHQYTKDEILELYLNKMYFGAGLYGAEAASLGYFGKPARELSVEEAALLAGLVKSPSTWAPTVNLDRAVARRNVVLQAMRDEGDLDPATFERAKASAVTLRDALRRDEPFGQYFKEQVRLELIERFGRERVYQSGLRVYTTIDVEMQKAAEAAVAKSLVDLSNRRQAALKARRRTDPVDDAPLQAALVALDPRTGQVRAIVGGRSFSESHFNRAVQAKRQPGSAFKPFVYAAALESGYTPASLIDRLDEPFDTLQGAWSPEEGHDSATELTMRAALKTSSNRAAVRMLEMVGVTSAVDYAKKLGLGDVPAVPSLALGSGEVTLFDMTSAYGAFANGGVWERPQLVRRVEDTEGNVLFRAEETAVPAVSPATAFLMSSMLADVIDSGTGWKARQLGFRLPASGKTGTTNEYRDAWFVGYTPSLTAGVWVGYDTPRQILPGSAYAGDVAVPLWAEFMKAATANDKPERLAAPRNIVGVTVCRLSGKRPAGGCDAVPVVDDDGHESERSMIGTEYFVRGTEPDQLCHLHVGRSFFGRLAGWLGNEPRAEVTQQRANESAPAEAPAAAAAASPDEKAEEVATAPAPERKKRGFWSRLFGRGDKDDKDKDEKDKDEKKDPPNNRRRR
jgi:1A family penicillin-binding protein